MAFYSIFFCVSQVSSALKKKQIGESELENRTEKIRFILDAFFSNNCFVFRRYPVRDLAHLMITISDNTATNMLIDKIGFEEINRVIREDLDMPSMRLGAHCWLG